MGAPAIATRGSTVRVHAESLKAYDPQGLGVHQADFRDLLALIEGHSQSEIIDLLEKAAETASGLPGRDGAAYSTAVLVLRDYILGGYYPIVANGRCFLASLWDSESLPDQLKRTALRRMYENMRERDLSNDKERPRLATFVQSLDVNGGYNPSAVLRLLDAAAFEPELQRVDDGYARDLWRSVRATWSMTPDRSAPGREVSFILTDRRHRATPIGILQFRNVVPEIKARDTWLGTVVSLSTSHSAQGFARAIQDSGDVKAALSGTVSTLNNLLSSVNPDGIAQQLAMRDEGQLREVAATNRAAFNASRKRKDKDAAARYLAICKRAETAADICRGLSAFKVISQSSEPLAELRNTQLAARLEAGLRKIWHYHMGFVAIELSVCGAAPPFNVIRAGKLMASLAGAREALEAWGYDRPLGQIAQQVYLPEVRDRVRNPGPLVLLTSGLYPGHSAQYTRACSGERKWIKYGETSGYGSFHISAATMSATSRLNREWDGYRHITRAFGEGSGAKFREVGRALDRLNLPDLRRHDTRRPLYALPLVDDVAGVLFGWADNQTSEQPCVVDLADQWQRRWLEPRQAELVERTMRAPDLAETLAATQLGSRQHVI
jgi:hypothetical protein